MILTRLRHLHTVIIHCQKSKTNEFMFNGNIYWFSDSKRIKSKTYSQRINNSQTLFASIERNSDKRLFKKSAATINPDKAKQTQGKLFGQKQNIQQDDTSQQPPQPNTQSQLPLSPPAQALTPQQQRELSSFKNRTCQLLLNDFKDQIKQSNNVNSINHIFAKSIAQLKENSVEDTELKTKYKSVMFACVMRALSRILRRESFLQRVKLFWLIGDQYQAIADLQLSCLTTLELSDFVAFFFMFQSVYKFRTISPAKITVIQKYLQEIYNRYTLNGPQSGHTPKPSQIGQNSIKNVERSDYSERQYQITSQKQDKRFVSELIIVAKTAQMFHSSLFDKFLDILLKNINQRQLRPYKITSLVKFLLKPQNLTSVQKQLQLLNMLVKKMHSTDILKDFRCFVLKELYINLSALVDNNQLLMDMSQAKAMIKNIEEYAISLLPKMVTSEIYQFALFSFKREGEGNHELGKYILKYVFGQIKLNGQTSLNPLIVINLVSTNVDETVKFTQIDPQWQDKFVNMYNMYLVDAKPCPNLTYCEPQLTKIFYHIHSPKIKQTIVQSFISPTQTCIIPYDQQSFLLQNYYIQQNDKPKIFASLYRLYSMQPQSQKTKGLLKDVFETLQKSHITDEVKKQLYESQKKYINLLNPLKVNRGWYIKTLIRYCFKLGHQQLVYSIFAQELTWTVDQMADFNKKSSQISDSQHKSNHPRFNVPKAIDQKCRDKINALFYNFISVVFQFDLKLAKRQQSTSFQQKLKANQFITLVKSHEVFTDIFVQLMTMRDTANVVHYHGNQEKVEFLLEVLKFLTVGKGQKLTMREEDYHKGVQKYYFAYYQILKNYPIQRLRKLLSSPLCKQAVSKILYSRTQIKNTNDKTNNFDQNGTKSTQALFTYDKSTGQVLIIEQQAKILRQRVEKGLELESARTNTDKLA